MFELLTDEEVREAYGDYREDFRKARGLEQGLQALVESLKPFMIDFDTLYSTIIKNDGYTDVSREQVMKYF